MIREMLFCTAVILGAAATLWTVIALISTVLCPTDGGERVYTVIPVKGHREDIEFVIREAAASRKRGGVILVADFGADRETAAIARRLCSEYNRMEWVRGEAIELCLRQYVNCGEREPTEMN